jgi:transcriptional regulator with PAS, ATPase and Fis domain
MKPESDNSEQTSLPPNSTPRYFHLLWDEELETLQPVFQSLMKNRDQVLSNWHNLYVLHFGNTRSLTPTEFFDIFGSELDTTVKDLLRTDMEGFAADMRQVGETLAQRSVPFAEVIVSMHLFEESAAAAFPNNPPSLARTYQLFDKLSHCRMIILADTYFRSKSSVSGARIKALEREAKALPANARGRFHGLVGSSPAMRRLYERIEATAATRGTVLISGESGTGKELVARAIHEAGPSPGAPFVALNCAAIPRDLIESELFGYRRGAFSGANTEYLGLFRAAEGGTLLLDEITEMSAETQGKLLRAIQERTVRPVGSTREIPVSARLIASTNRDPSFAVANGLLRPDLYYRLQASTISVPPLREHIEDVDPLVEHFIEVFNQKEIRSAPVVGIEEEGLAALRGHSWPGNVRELANALESAFTFGRSPLIRLDDLPATIRGFNATTRPSAPASPVGSFAEAERALISRALESTGGNKVAAARILKISRKKLYAKISKYKIELGSRL